MSNTNTKGLVLAALMMVVLSTVTLVGMAIIDGFGDATKVSTAAGNESFTAVADTFVSLANDEWVSTGTVTVFNVTGNVTRENIDYFVDYGRGAINVSTAAVANYTTTLKANYTYLHDSDASTTATLFVAGLGVFGTFCALIALVLVGSILIGLIRGTKES